MLKSNPEQAYVQTKDSIFTLQNTHLSLFQASQPFATACALSEPTLVFALSAAELDGRWLQIPTAERWELLLSTAYSTAPSKTPDNSKYYTAQ
jgi:hypothetical protein